MPPPSRTPPLAIVLPAYRVRFLREAIASLAAQTRRDFRLYVFDDASPDDLEPIASSFRDTIDLRFHRFPQNLGGRNLIAHWRRCIALTENEPWLWVFSDDDIAAPAALETFFECLDRGPPCALWRFDLDFIDEHGRVSHACAPHPDFENAFELTRAILHPQGRDWRATDHIFSRRAYETLDGFVEFPRAIFSDFATWLKFSTLNGVRTVRGPRIGWRFCGANVTAQAFAPHRHMIDPHLQFHEWLAAFVHRFSPQEQATLEGLRRAQFFEWITKWPVPFADILDGRKTADHLWPAARSANMKTLCRGEIRRVASRIPLMRRYQTWRIKRAHAPA